MQSGGPAADATTPKRKPLESLKSPKAGGPRVRAASSSPSVRGAAPAEGAPRRGASRPPPRSPRRREGSAGSGGGPRPKRAARKGRRRKPAEPPRPPWSPNARSQAPTADVLADSVKRGTAPPSADASPPKKLTSVEQDELNRRMFHSALERLEAHERFLRQLREAERPATSTLTAQELQQLVARLYCLPRSSLAPPEEASPKPLVDRDGGLWQGLLKRLYYDEVAKAKHQAREKDDNQLSNSYDDWVSQEGVEEQRLLFGGPSPDGTGGDYVLRLSRSKQLRLLRQQLTAAAVVIQSFYRACRAWRRIRRSTPDPPTPRTHRCQAMVYAARAGPTTPTPDRLGQLLAAGPASCNLSPRRPPTPPGPSSVDGGRPPTGWPPVYLHHTTGDSASLWEAHALQETTGQTAPAVAASSPQRASPSPASTLTPPFCPTASLRSFTALTPLLSDAAAHSDSDHSLRTPVHLGPRPEPTTAATTEAVQLPLAQRPPRPTAPEFGGTMPTPAVHSLNAPAAEDRNSWHAAALLEEVIRLQQRERSHRAVLRSYAKWLRSQGSPMPDFMKTSPSASPSESSVLSEAQHGASAAEGQVGWSSPMQGRPPAPTQTPAAGQSFRDVFRDVLRRARQDPHPPPAQPAETPPRRSQADVLQRLTSGLPSISLEEAGEQLRRGAFLQRAPRRSRSAGSQQPTTGSSPVPRPTLYRSASAGWRTPAPTTPARRSRSPGRHPSPTRSAMDRSAVENADGELPAEWQRPATLGVSAWERRMRWDEGNRRQLLRQAMALQLQRRRRQALLNLQCLERGRRHGLASEAWAGLQHLAADWMAGMEAAQHAAAYRRQAEVLAEYQRLLAHQGLAQEAARQHTAMREGLQRVLATAEREGRAALEQAELLAHYALAEEAAAAHTEALLRAEERREWEAALVLERQRRAVEEEAEGRLWLQLHQEAQFREVVWRAALERLELSERKPQEEEFHRLAQQLQLAVARRLAAEQAQELLEQRARELARVIHAVGLAEQSCRCSVEEAEAIGWQRVQQFVTMMEQLAAHAPPAPNPQLATPAAPTASQPPFEPIPPPTQAEALEFLSPSHSDPITDTCVQALPPGLPAQSSGLPLPGSAVPCATPTAFSPPPLSSPPADEPQPAAAVAGPPVPRVAAEPPPGPPPANLDHTGPLTAAPPPAPPPAPPQPQGPEQWLGAPDATVAYTRCSEDGPRHRPTHHSAVLVPHTPGCELGPASGAVRHDASTNTDPSPLSPAPDAPAAELPTALATSPTLPVALSLSPTNVPDPGTALPPAPILVPSLALDKMPTAPVADRVESGVQEAVASPMPSYPRTDVVQCSTALPAVPITTTSVRAQEPPASAETTQPTPLTESYTAAKGVADIGLAPVPTVPPPLAILVSSADPCAASQSVPAAPTFSAMAAPSAMATPGAAAVLSPDATVAISELVRQQWMMMALLLQCQWQATRRSAAPSPRSPNASPHTSPKPLRFQLPTSLRRASDPGLATSSLSDLAGSPTRPAGLGRQCRSPPRPATPSPASPASSPKQPPGQPSVPTDGDADPSVSPPRRTDSVWQWQDFHLTPPSPQHLAPPSPRHLRFQLPDHAHLSPEPGALPSPSRYLSVPPSPTADRPASPSHRNNSPKLRRSPPRLAPPSPTSLASPPKRLPVNLRRSSDPGPAHPDPAPSLPQRAHTDSLWQWDTLHLTPPSPKQLRFQLPAEPPAASSAPGSPRPGGGGGGGPDLPPATQSLALPLSPVATQPASPTHRNASPRQRQPLSVRRPSPLHVGPSPPCSPTSLMSSLTSL